MAATAVVTVTDAWAEVIDVLETTWFIQNVGSSPVFVFMKTTTPVATDKGHLLDNKEWMSSADFGAGDIWVRNAGSSASVVAITK